VIEISASGRTPYRRTVDVRAGETVTLNVSLSR
jgi:N-acetylmuramic acid 6-phosphate (MurNAc-6-P) etherase